MHNYAQEFPHDRDPRSSAVPTAGTPSVTSARSARLRDLTEARAGQHISREFIFGRSNKPSIQRQYDDFTTSRAKLGKPGLSANVRPEYMPDPVDEVIMWERLILVLTGPAEALDAIKLDGLDEQAAERRVCTERLLAAAAAAVRLDDYRYRSREEGVHSTPAKMEAYVRDVPGGLIRTRLAPTQRDVDLAAQARAWVLRQEPSNEYVASLQRILSQVHMGYRDVPTAVSVFAGYLRELAAKTPTRQRSQHLNRLGDKIRVEATVRKVQALYHPQRQGANWLHLMATDGGDVVKWISRSDPGLRVGDRVEVFGQVVEHAEYRGEQQTVLGADSVARPYART